MRFPLFVIALVACLVASFGAEHRSVARSAATTAITCGESPRSGDGWLQKSVTSASIAATPVSARLPAVAENASSRLRTATRRFSRDFFERPPTHWSARTVFRRHIPRMDTGEPPSSGRSAS